MNEMTAHDRFLERQRIANERSIEMGYGKAVEDALVGGTGITKDGKRIDPASIYSDIVSDGGMDPRNQFDKPAPVAHPVIAGALFDFMGWLTSRKKTLILSSADNASPAVEAITEFAKMRGLSLDGARVQDWQDIAPKQDVPETNFGNMAEPRIGCVNHDCDKCKAVQEPWVGLTDEEIDLFINGRGDEDDDNYVEPTGDGFGLTDADLVTLVRRAEAKLKEKNHG